jgi:hypothetical protein
MTHTYTRTHTITNLDHLQLLHSIAAVRTVTRSDVRKNFFSLNLTVSIAVAPVVDPKHTN